MPPRSGNSSPYVEAAVTDGHRTGHESQTQLTDLLASTRTGEDQQVIVAELCHRGKSALDEIHKTHDLVVSVASGPLSMYAVGASKNSRAH